MRLVAVLASFVALLATSVLGVAVVKLRRELAATRADLAALRDSGREARDLFAGADGEGAPAKVRAIEAAVAAAPRLAGATLAPRPGAEPPGPPLLDSPEVKAEVRKMVAEQLAEAQQRRAAAFEQHEQQRRERLAVELGLDQAERERFLTVLAAAQAEWRQLREQERTGEKAIADLRPQMEAVRQKSDQALRELLGEERMQKYQSLRPSQRGMGPDLVPPPPGPRGP